MSFAAAVLLLSLALHWPSFIPAPLDRDEGAYAFIAQQWARGAIPYRDYFDHKPPLVYLAYRLAFVIFGDDLAGVRVVFALATAASALACGLVVQRLQRERTLLPVVTAALAACVFLSSPLVQGESANTETLMGLATTWSAFFLMIEPSAGLVERRSWWRRPFESDTVPALMAGIGTGLACLAKLPAAFEGMFFLFWLLTNRKKRARAAIMFLCGAALPAALWMVYAVAHQAAAATLDAVIFYNLAYAGAGAVPLWARLVAVPIKYGVPMALLWAGLAGCTLTELRAVPRPADFALGWTGAALLGVIAGGRIYDHYYQELVPPLAVALGVSVGAVAARGPRRMMTAALVVGIVLGLLPPLTAVAGLARGDTVHPPATWQPRLATVVRALSARGDSLLVWGAEPYLYFAAERQPPGRYIYKYAAGAHERGCARLGPRTPDVLIAVKRDATPESPRASADELADLGAPLHACIAGLVPVLDTTNFTVYTRDATAADTWHTQWEGLAARE